METLIISKRKFKTLETYKLDDSISNNEGKLYVVPGPKKYLLKKLDSDEGENLGNKLLTINTLIDNKEEIGIDDLVLPERMGIVGKRIVGPISSLIEDSQNLALLLKNSNVPSINKIDWLRQVGSILARVQHVEKFKNKFFLGDVHENNFIVEKGKRVLAVDTDSCKIGDNLPFESKYLIFNHNIKNLDKKYPYNEYGLHMPNANTEWFCYNLIILNYIAQGPIFDLNIANFYDYLQYLKDLGFPTEIIDCFAKIYTNADNKSPQHLLEQIPDDISKANYNIFMQKKKIA